MPDEPFFGDPTCLPAEVDGFAPPTSVGTLGFGARLATLRYSGMLNNNDDSHMNLVAVASSTGFCSAAPCGFVGGGEVDVGTGELTGNDASLPIPFTAGEFGQAVLGVDLVEPVTDGSRAPFRHLAGGEELLVGDPDPSGGTASDTGRVHWLHVEYSGAFDASEVAVFDRYRWVEGGDFAPRTLTGGAEFGAALAALPAPYGEQVEAVVVGAPGENAVYILQVDPTWDTTATPYVGTPFADTTATLRKIALTDLGACTPPGPVSRFGAQVLFHDLNGDGEAELVVGAPGASGSGDPGHVFVLDGSASFPYAQTAGCLAFSNVNGGPGDELGASLAAGPIQTPSDHHLLVAGSPGETSASGVAQSGGVCIVLLDDDDATTGGLVFDTSFAAGGVDCRSNPFPIATGDAQRFGSGLAIGNFVPLDRTGDRSSQYATVNELAVGTPGGREVEETLVSSGGSSISTFEYGNAPGALAAGTVTLFRGSESGPRMYPPAGTGGGAGTAMHHVQLINTGAAGDAYGAAVLTADLQRNDSPDLIIGAPDRVPSGRTSADGEVFVTRGTASNGLQTGLSGIYEVPDASGSAPKKSRVLDFGSAGVSIAAEGFIMTISDSTSNLCTIDTDGDGTPEFTGTATFDLYSALVPLDPSTHDSEASGYDLMLAIPPSGVGGVTGMTVTGKLWVDSSTVPNATIRYTLDEPEVNGSDPWPSLACAPAPSPNALTFQSFATCEE